MSTNKESTESLIQHSALEVGVAESAATNIAKHLQASGYKLVKMSDEEQKTLKSQMRTGESKSSSSSSNKNTNTK